MTTSNVAITISCDRLALPKTAPNDMRTAAAQKSATNKLNNNPYLSKQKIKKKRGEHFFLLFDID